MSTCKGPGCGVQWICDMQHGVVDGRCADCQTMAAAASNLNVHQIMAVLLRVVGKPKDSGRLDCASFARSTAAWDMSIPPTCSCQAPDTYKGLRGVA